MQTRKRLGGHLRCFGARLNCSPFEAAEPPIAPSHNNAVHCPTYTSRSFFLGDLRKLPSNFEMELTIHWLLHRS